ncbi:MAG TPA: glycosyltransferase [Pyrinomonadaceae bacterium]|nr:glycosyltransferase [Pyrinomonadaceae bacterium]
MDQRKRVLHVLFHGGLGGCESLCLDLVRHLDAARWDSEVVFLSEEGGPVLDRLNEMGTRIHVCAYERRERLSFVRRFARLCRAVKPNVVLTHSFGLHLFVAMGARLAGVKRVLVSVQNPPPNGTALRRKTALLAQLSRPFVDRELACSNYVSDKVVGQYGLPRRRVSVLWNWCDTESIAARAGRAREARTDVGPIIGIVARLDPIKDHATVLRAFQLFRREYSGAPLRLIGDGPMRARLEELASELSLGESIEFAGARTDVPEQVGQLDIFVYATTANEGFGIVLAEAMAAGVPIVATDCGPCAEVLDDGRAGLLVSPGDPEALSEGLKTLWEDAGLRERLAANALRTAHARYSVKRAVENLETYLNA